MILVVLKLVLIAALVGYLHYTNRGIFQGSSVSGLPDGRIRADRTTVMSHNFGSVSFNWYGEEIGIFMAYYEGEELVLRESVAAFGTRGASLLGGTAQWVLTMSGNTREELRAYIGIQGALAQGYFDFSQIDFTPGLIVRADMTIPNRPITGGERYVLQVWQTGTSWRADNNPFHPEALRGNEKTAILYIVFE